MLQTKTIQVIHLRLHSPNSPHRPLDDWYHIYFLALVKRFQDNPYLRWTSFKLNNRIPFI